MYKSLKINLLVVIISIIVGILIFEVFIRSKDKSTNFGPQKRTYYARSTVEGIPYTLKPKMDKHFSFGRITSNGDGFRTTHSQTKKKGENVFRILTIGDSITFGFGVDQNQAYPQQLETILNISNAANIRYEVINAGVDGFNAVDELHVLKYLLPKYHPDLIIWFLVNNDWDDSLSINNRGQLVSMYKKYAASICWLDLTWGWNTPLCYPDNFYLSMNERSRYWAEGKSWSLLKKLDNKMKNHFNFYDIIRDRIVSSVRNSVPQDTNERAFPKSIFKASITLSPYYNHRFYTAVNKGTLYALNNHIPVILYGLNIPFDDGRLKHDILFEDITQYFGMSVNSFLNKYNLGWDSHFNSEGNRIIAESIIQSLVKHNLIRDVSVNGYHNNLSEDKSWNWAQHKKSREKFIQKFIQPYVDFKKFQNIHQLVGGLLPTRVFPIFDGAMLALILKQEGSNSLYILGDNRSENDIEILVQIGIDEYEKEISVPSGTFEEIILIPNTIKEYYHKNIIDIRIECLKETNPVIQLSYIGLQKPSTAPIQPLIMGDVEP